MYKKILIVCFLSFSCAVAGQKPIKSPHANFLWHDKCCWVHSSIQCFFKTKELTEKLLEHSFGQVPTNQEEILIAYVEMLKEAYNVTLKNSPKLVLEDYPGGRWNADQPKKNISGRFYTKFINGRDFSRGGAPYIFCSEFIQFLQDSSLFIKKDDGKNFIRYYYVPELRSTMNVHQSKKVEFEKDFKTFGAPKYLVFSTKSLLDLWPQDSNWKWDPWGKDPWVCPTGQQYTIYAVIVGTAEHVWAYAKDGYTNDWYFYDDFRNKIEKADQKIIKNILVNKCDAPVGGKAVLPQVFFYQRVDDSLSEKVLKYSTSLQRLKDRLIQLSMQLTAVRKKLG